LFNPVQATKQMNEEAMEVMATTEEKRKTSEKSNKVSKDKRKKRNII